MTSLPLFPGCPLPGCNGVTDDPRVPCAGCQAAFGDMLRESGRPAPEPEQYAAALAERDQAVTEAYAAQASLAAAATPPPPVVQRCWSCTRARRCKPDPAGPPGGLICAECAAMLAPVRAGG